MTALSLAAVAALVTGLATILLLRRRKSLPHATLTPRSLHTVPVPRVGGIALWVGFLPVAFAAPAPSWLSPAIWAGPLLVLALVSLIDDVRAVPIGIRLAAHLVSATWFALLIGGEAGLGAWSMLTVILIAAWSANLFNFMDGSDGLAALMAVAGFGAYSAALACSGLETSLPLALACAVLPVLAVNWPPARVFLGDVGAVPLGFLAAAFGIAGSLFGAWGAWFPVLVFLPFVADASLTLLTRALRRDRFWEGHRTHYYQRLHQLGAGHRGTLAVGGVVIVGTAGTAVACACVRPDLGPFALIAWCVILAGSFAIIDRRWRRRTRKNV